MSNLVTTGNEFAISCDWLQLHVKENEDILSKETPFFQVKRTGQSKVFKNIYTIYNTVTGLEVATYAKDANKCILPESHGILKIDNAQLYIHEDLKIYVEDFLKKLSLEFIGITRLDIAYDFQQFRNELDPQEFIRMYVHNEIKRCWKKSTFQLAGKETEGSNIYETLKIGAPTSNITTKLYNKTKEMLVNYKPYIKALHDVSFPAPINNEVEKDIWRLEFSVFSVVALLKTDEGKEFPFHSLEMLDLKNLYGMFQGLFKSRFKFKKKGTGNRVTRMEEIELLVFDFPVTELHLIKQNPIVRASSRSHKIFLKKANDLREEMARYDQTFVEETNEIIDQVLDFTVKQNFREILFQMLIQARLFPQQKIPFPELIGKFESLHGLRPWAAKKKINFTGFENYANDLYEVQKIIFCDSTNERLETNKKTRDLTINKQAREFDEKNRLEWEAYEKSL